MKNSVFVLFNSIHSIIYFWMDLIWYSYQMVYLQLASTMIHKVVLFLTWVTTSEEFELIGTHIEIVGSFWEHSVSLQRAHTMSSHCELSKSFLRVCNSHHEIILMSSLCSGSNELTVSSLCSSHLYWVSNITHANVTRLNK